MEPICECHHYYSTHKDGIRCQANGCPCIGFRSPANNLGVGIPPNALRAMLPPYELNPSIDPKKDNILPLEVCSCGHYLSVHMNGGPCRMPSCNCVCYRLSILPMKEEPTDAPQTVWYVDLQVLNMNVAKFGHPSHKVSFPISREAWEKLDRPTSLRVQIDTEPFKMVPVSKTEEGDY